MVPTHESRNVWHETCPIAIRRTVNPIYIVCRQNGSPFKSGALSLTSADKGGVKNSMCIVPDYISIRNEIFCRLRIQNNSYLLYAVPSKFMKHLKNRRVLTF